MLSEAKHLYRRKEILPGTDQPGRCRSQQALPQDDITFIHGGHHAREFIGMVRYGNEKAPNEIRIKTLE